MTRALTILMVWLVLTGCTVLYQTPGGGLIMVHVPAGQGSPHIPTMTPGLTMTPASTVVSTFDPTPTIESATWTPVPTSQVFAEVICNRVVSGGGINVRAERSVNSSVVERLALNECAFLEFEDVDTANRVWYGVCLMTVTGECHAARRGWIASWSSANREAWLG